MKILVMTDNQLKEVKDSPLSLDGYLVQKCLQVVYDMGEVTLVKMI